MILPDRIHAIKTITYDVQNIVESLKEMNDDPDYAPTLEEVMDYVDDWLYDDFVHVDGVVLQDENGNAL